MHAAAPPGLALAGLGLRTPHLPQVLDTGCAAGFVEVHAENYMVAGGPMLRQLTAVRARYELSLHGVGLSVGGESLDEPHLARLAELVRRFEPRWVSEHLAWSRHQGRCFNDLLPLPYDRPTLERVCRHVDRVQTVLKRRLLLENPSTYLRLSSSTLDEGEFLAEVVRRTGCGLLLDVTNVWVSAHNQGADPQAWLEAWPLQAVGEIHLAGCEAVVDPCGRPLLVDTHGAPIDEAVWRLYAHVLARTGPRPTLIERDRRLPPLSELEREVRRAAGLLAHVAPSTVAAPAGGTGTRGAPALRAEGPA